MDIRDTAVTSRKGRSLLPRLPAFLVLFMACGGSFLPLRANTSVVVTIGFDSLFQAINSYESFGDPRCDSTPGDHLATCGLIGLAIAPEISDYHLMAPTVPDPVDPANPWTATIVAAGNPGPFPDLPEFANFSALGGATYFTMATDYPGVPTGKYKSRSATTAFPQDASLGLNLVLSGPVVPTTIRWDVQLLLLPINPNGSLAIKPLQALIEYSPPAAVPEPGTCVLLGCGLGLMFCSRIRRSKDRKERLSMTSPGGTEPKPDSQPLATN